MKLSDSLGVLEKVGIVEWASRDVRNATQLYINAVAEHYLGKICPLDLRPFIESDYVYDYFSEHDWEIDWYELISGEFVKTVEAEINSIALSANEIDPAMSVNELQEYIIGWVEEWTWRAQERLKAALEAVA